jgi:hypothetical protein
MTTDLAQLIDTYCQAWSDGATFGPLAAVGA